MLILGCQVSCWRFAALPPLRRGLGLGWQVWVKQLSAGRRLDILPTSFEMPRLLASLPALPATAASPAAAPRRALPVGARRRDGSRRRSARRGRRLAKDLGARLLVPALLLLSLSLLLGADLFWSHGRLLLGGIVIIVERHLRHARRGVPLGDDGPPAEDFDLRLEV